MRPQLCHNSSSLRILALPSIGSTSLVFVAALSQNNGNEGKSSTNREYIWFS